LVLGTAVARPARAQTESAGADRPSFLTIIFEGAEWPGAIIAIMSVAALTLVAEHFITIRRSTMCPAEEVESARGMIEARRMKECVDSLRASNSMFAHLLVAGMQHGRHGFEAMHEAVDELAAAWSSRLFRRAEYLSVLGNLGPLMGLLGTVLGMIQAFGEMQATRGLYKTEDLAGGISLALVNTFLGLGLAIVGLGFFGVCRNRVDRFTVEARASAIELLEYFRPLAQPGQIQTSPVAPGR
jgi:biopolymer transport protein ExbB